MKRTGFFRQSGVLISRYLKIFFNDKQNLALTIAIPLLTILLVCCVAAEDMFACSTEKDNCINDGYPILAWEDVDYECSKEDDEDKDEDKDKEDEEDTTKVWGDSQSETLSLMPADSDGKKYYISVPEDMQKIAQLKGEWLKKTYYLNNDMDFNGETIIPIGTEDDPFTGVFEGNGHVIKNFKLETKSDCVGLFGSVSGEDAKIANLGVENAEITRNENHSSIGIIAGEVDNAVIDNCFSVKSTVDVRGENVGGIAGTVVGKKAVVRNCYSRADIKVDGSNAGGIAGSVIKGGLQYTYYAGEFNKGGNDDEEYFGCIAGSLENDENSFFNVYDKELCEDYKAIGSDDEDSKDIKDKTIEGWSTDDLKQNASLIRTLEKDVEEDENGDTFNGNFKNDGELADFSGTQTGLFMLACVAIFVGICNSIQEICKERNILKREYMTNLRLSSYMISKLAVQGLVCAVQTVVVLVIFYISVADKVYPSRGVILPSSKLEVFITMFLLTYASDAIALLVSSLVKNSSTANTFIPIILIVQIIFSGVLFELGDVLDKLAGIMISKWGIGALAATCRLNESRLAMLMNNPQMALSMGDDMSRIKDLYVATPGNLLSIWGILILFVVVCSVLSGLLLTRVKKDKR